MLNELTTVVALMVLGQTPLSASIRPGEFEKWIHFAELGELEIPSEVKLKGAGFRYVFVGGFRNERMPSYFAQNIKDLKAFGVPRQAIHILNPSSFQTSEQNIDEIRSQFFEIASQGSERLVIIGHSRGACDALAFAIANAGFVRDRVEALFLIQGPFGGSAAAEYAVGKGQPMDRRMWLSHRVLGNLAGRVVRWMSRGPALDVLEEMTRNASRNYWSKTIAEHAEALTIVGPKTFYVRSKIEPSKLRFFRRAIARYLQTYHGPSDGLVGLADQMLPDLGTVIATMEAGHGDLTHRFPATRASRTLRRALVQSILMAVGRPGLEITGTSRWSDPGSDDLDLLEHPVPKRQPSLQGNPGSEPSVTPTR